MAGSTWLEWLPGVVSGLIWGPEAAPGTHQAGLEQKRVGALLEKEKRKPPGQGDEELIHALRVDYRRRQLLNLQVRRRCRRAAAACKQN